jgi:hypothetical protein
MRKFLLRFRAYIVQDKRWRWIMTASVPVCLAGAIIGWPSYLSAVAIFITGANVMTTLYLWHPRLVPFVIQQPTPAEIEQMRAMVRPVLAQIAREVGEEVFKEMGTEIFEELPPLASRH